jgi:hypothetical protein
MSAAGGEGTGLRIAQGVLAAVGTALAAVGAWLLLASGPGNVVSASVWLAGGVVAHDALLAPVTVFVVLVASRVVPRWLRAPMAVGFVVLGTVTVAAIPVLGRFGARPDNPSLLDRNYAAGWLVFAAVVVIAVSIAGWRRRAAAGAGMAVAPRRPTPMR